MEKLEITTTDRTPLVSFDFEKGRLKLKGESYPEDAAGFYGPVLSALDAYLENLRSGTCRLDLELVYFNSSSAKAIMMLLEKLDRAAADGASVEIYWHYDPDDDTMREVGEEFGEDIEHALYHLRRRPGRK